MSWRKIYKRTERVVTYCIFMPCSVVPGKLRVRAFRDPLTVACADQALLNFHHHPQKAPLPHSGVIHVQGDGEHVQYLSAYVLSGYQLDAVRCIGILGPQPPCGWQIHRHWSPDDPPNFNDVAGLERQQRTGSGERRRRRVTSRAQSKVCDARK